MNELNGLLSIARKEVIHIRRDFTTIIFALVIPMMQLMLFGFALDFDVRHVQTAIIDMDRSPDSRTYVASLRNTQYLDIAKYLDTPEQAEEQLRRGEIRVAVIVPPDFSRLKAAKQSAYVRVMIDGSDGQVASPARNAFRRPPDSASGQDVEARVNVLYNPDLRTQVYTIPGLVGVILQMVTVSLTSFSLVREKEQGTLEQLMVSPVGRLGIMIGKIAPYAALAMFELLLVLTLARLVFNVQVSGSFVLLVSMSLPFILAALSLGLLISAVAKTQGQALQMALLTLLPSILLSGYISPRETLPGPLWVLSNVLPVTHFIQIARGIIVRGAGFTDVLPSMLNLCLITVLLIALATSRFRKSMA